MEKLVSKLPNKKAAVMFQECISGTESKNLCTKSFYRLLWAINGCIDVLQTVAIFPSRELEVTSVLTLSEESRIYFVERILGSL